MHIRYVEIEVDKIEAIETKYYASTIVMQVENLDLYNLLQQYPVEDIIRAIGYDTLLENMYECDIVDWVQEFTKYIVSEPNSKQ